MKTLINNNLSDPELIKLFNLGKKESFSVLYNRYYSKVYGLCLNMIKQEDEAADIAQEIMLKVYQKLNTFKMESLFSTWLYRVSRNHCVQLLRSKRIVIYDSLDKYISVPYEKEEENSCYIENVRETCLNNTLENINNEDKSLLLLKYRDEFTIKMLQERFKLSESAVKMRLQRARLRASRIFKDRMRLAEAV